MATLTYSIEEMRSAVEAMDRVRKILVEREAVLDPLDAKIALYYALLSRAEEIVSTLPEGSAYLTSVVIENVTGWVEALDLAYIEGWIRP